ncbi:hypothetical protein B0H12DRAFT_1261964 [Mycena haematopus]|nr:hypothetical protein B0H12DRAFT_1261964 [Mycena haematopus]
MTKLRLGTACICQVHFATRQVPLASPAAQQPPRPHIISVDFGAPEPLPCSASIDLLADGSKSSSSATVLNANQSYLISARPSEQKTTARRVSSRTPISAHSGMTTRREVNPHVVGLRRSCKRRGGQREARRRHVAGTPPGMHPRKERYVTKHETTADLLHDEQEAESRIQVSSRRRAHKRKSLSIYVAGPSKRLQLIASLV